MKITLVDSEENRDFLVEGIQEGGVQTRLYDMGITPGVKVRRLFSAPGGCPIAFLVNEDYVLGLRREEANQIKIKEYGE